MLQIVLTDGFAGDEVVVRVQGDEVFHDVVHTDQRVGVARALKPVPRDGPVAVEVALPSRGLAGATEARIEHSRVEVAFVNGALRIVPSSGQTYGYA